MLNLSAVDNGNRNYRYFWSLPEENRLFLLTPTYDIKTRSVFQKSSSPVGRSWGGGLMLLLCLLLSTTLPAQTWTTTPWPASWITHPTAPATEFAVVNFRRTFNLETLPDSLPVMVSADNRYQFFVNGRRVGEGPSRGDLLHWRYETYDLRPYIQEGKNVIAAIVWNYGIDKPWSQESYRLGFLLQPKSDAFAELKTDEKWLTYHNQAYSPILGSRERLGTYIVTGPQLQIDGDKFPWAWDADEEWLPAKTITRGSPIEGGTEIYWGLVPREIPIIERKELALPEVIFANGSRYPFTWWTVGKDTTETILLDYGRVQNMFLTIGVTGARDTEIKVTYAESLFNDDGTKGHRDSTSGKMIKGVYDIIHPQYDTLMPASNSRLAYDTPWFRTGRYVELEIKTGSTGAVISDILTESFAYPFTEVASFTDSSNTHRTNEIWEVGWQTARMCAQETYVDCPYYEQLQYVGDTRIQALISLYVSGDDRLMRKAIKLFDQSRMTEGLTQSRYPSNVPQVIPPYSLSWVEMVGDYWMHRPDTAFVRARLEGVKSVLAWYDRQLLPNGMIGPTPYWNFVDWTPQWPWNNETRTGGVPDLEGGSSIISLQYVSALRTAAKLFAYFGDQSQANAYNYQADGIAGAVTRLCWKGDRELFSDTPKGKSFSQHANIMALLTDLAPAAAPTIMLSGSEGIRTYQQALLNKILTDESLTQVSEYFRFFLVQSMYHTDNAGLYEDQLEIWESYLDQGFTTFPEKPGETRSDCHAWSASPNYDLLATLAGIRPASPGFERVSITPAWTDFAYRAVAVHPKGTITVSSSGGGKDTHFEVELPAGITGLFRMDGQEYELKGGMNRLTIGHE